MTTTYIVITHAPEPPDTGNLAALGPCWAQVEQPSQENDWNGKVVPLHEVDPHLAMAALTVFRTPVFYAGEILVVESTTGREIGGRGRKPSKWGVTYEEFVTIESAEDCARKVMEEMGI